METKFITNATLNVLSLEDCIPDFEIISQQLIKAGYNLTISRVEKEREFRSLLSETQYDIILADFNLPGFDAFGALRLCNEICPNVPFICVSGSIGEETAIELLKLGAVDYVLKDRPERLPFAINRALNDAKEKETSSHVKENLLRSEENFRRSISESPMGIRIVSVDGDTIYANKAFLDIYEFNSLEEFNSTPAKNRYTPESYVEHQERKEKRKSGHDVVDYEHSIVRKNEDVRYVKVWRKEILWNGVKHFQVLNQDITEQKKLTGDLLMAKEKAEESDRLKSAFLANISHEIRTPMNGILGFAELLKNQELTSDEQEKYIDIIEHSGTRMLNIINDLVDISKIEAGQMKVNLSETNVNEQIEYIYTFFKPEVEQKGLQLICKNSLPDREAIIQTDREKIYSILANLVKNAIKYTYTGSIEFGYNIVSGRDKACLVSTTMEFFVKDTGIGIPKDRQEAIFERFVQADISDKKALQGAGLGLSIAKAYIEMLGGKIRVESEPGNGSIFYFTIPYHVRLEVKNDIQKVVSMDEEENQARNLKIVIAEDDQASAILISMAIKGLSKEVIFVKDGIETVEACRNNPDADLVLMDIKMPGIDGYEATRAIRQFNQKIIIIAQTAYALIGDREKALEAGCTDYISKPVKKDQLLALVQKYF